MEKYLGIILLILLSFFAKNIRQPSGVLGETSVSAELPALQPLVTQSSFTQKLTEETEILPKKTIYGDDPHMEAGEEKVLAEGEDGKKIKKFKTTYSKDGKEYEKELISQETIPSQDKKILRGTKIVWRTLSTADGEIKYRKKMRVYATHYDSRCPGCDEWTAIGMKAGRGVIAVDPKVIPLRSKVYIPGYGTAVAGDTGGAIKGKIIDLGFEDARTAGWSARFIDIYLL